MKKVLRTLSIAALMAGGAVASTGCAGVKAAVYEAGNPVKVGLICLHDEQSTYDANFIDSLKKACVNLGDKVDGEPIIKTGVPETSDAFKAAKDLVKQGCNIVMADSFGHEEFIMQAAEKWPTVTFLHATGTHAGTAGIENFHNGFASIYEGRYLAGVAAGVKLQEMINASQIKPENMNGNDIKLGYVGAFQYAEVISGYTSWYLGVKSVVSNVSMEVQFTKSWYDVTGESTAAQTLIDRGAAIVSQHADSMGAPGTCETAGVPNVTYNVSTERDCPNTYVACSRIDWAPYYEAAVNGLYNGQGNAFDGENNNYVGTLAGGSVKYDVCSSASDDMKQAVNAAKAALLDGSLKVFNCANWTVEGQHLTEYLADTDGDYAGDTNAIKTEGGVTFFDESYYCSAPYFNIAIDGITTLNSGF